MASSIKHQRAGRICDPVFLCMVGAMVLAVASSVTLRAVMAHAGQLKNDSDEQIDPADGTPPPTAPIPHRPHAHSPPQSR